uniref:hypothetical protein n=1 Tax=Flavobacterium sp. TaxID=239 RepID=UPI00404A582B
MNSEAIEYFSSVVCIFERNRTNMISKRLQQWSVYSWISTLLFIVISFISGYYSFSTGTSDFRAVFVINRVVIVIIPIAGIWVNYAIIYNHEKKTLQNRIDRVKKDENTKSEFQPKIVALERLYERDGIDEEKYTII